MHPCTTALENSRPKRPLLTTSSAEQLVGIVRTITCELHDLWLRYVAR